MPRLKLLFCALLPAAGPSVLLSTHMSVSEEQLKEFLRNRAARMIQVGAGLSLLHDLISYC